MLTLTNISQQFGDKLLYEDVSVQINRGEKVGLIGRNSQTMALFNFRKI